MPAPYTKQTWTDGAGGGTPLSAARMGVIEQGIYDAHHPPVASVFRSANQNITTGAPQEILWDGEYMDNDVIHDLVTNTGRLTIKSLGLYLVTGIIAWAANSSGLRKLIINKNGAGVGWSSRVPVSGDVTYHDFVAGPFLLDVNDYLQVYGYQDSGSTVAVTTGSFVSVARLGSL